MIEKAIYRAMDDLRDQFNPQDAMETVIQFAAWASLSEREVIPEQLRYNKAASIDPAQIITALSNLGECDGLLSLAFSGSRRLNEANHNLIKRVFEFVMRVHETGAFQSIQIADLPLILKLWNRREPFFCLPPEVASLLVGMAYIHEGESVYTPWDMSGQLAARARKSASIVYLETPYSSALPALVSLLDGDQFSVHQADPIRSPSATECGRLIKFDFSISFPPIGTRYDGDVVEHDWLNRFPERTTSGSVLAVRHILSQSRRRAVVAVHNGLLFSTGSEMRLRKDLLGKGIIEAVVSMPAGLLYDTKIPFSVLVLNPAGGRDQVKFVDASRSIFLEKLPRSDAKLANAEMVLEILQSTKETEFSTTIPVLDIIRNDGQLQVNRYVVQDSKKKLNIAMKMSNTARLEEVVNIIRPFAVKANCDECIEVREIGVPDIPDFGYIERASRLTKIPFASPKKEEQHFLRYLDIVLVIKGSVGKVGIVSNSVPPAGPGGWIAGQSSIILRAHPSSIIDPRVLAVQLRAPLGQALLNGIVSGASIPLIQLRELTRMQLIVPSQAECSKAVDTLEQEATLQIEINRLLQEQAKISSGLWTLS